MTIDSAKSKLKADLAARRTRKLEILTRKIADLTKHQLNPRVHSRTQIKKLARSIKRFGFIVPVLIDRHSNIIAGHGRTLAAVEAGFSEVPTICIEHLTSEEVTAFRVADNQLCVISTWNTDLLGQTLKDLEGVNFDIDVIGFEPVESDLYIQGLDPVLPGLKNPEDQIPADSGPPVTRLGDLWIGGEHWLLCADALDAESYQKLLCSAKAAMVCTDPPYGVPVTGHMGGLGKIKHREFVMGSSPSTEADRIGFLTQVLRHLAGNSIAGSIHVVAMDFRHAYEILTAGRAAYSELKNICVWAKDNAGMGSMYRSQHEFFFVFKSGKGPHRNNVMLGKFGRHRSNVWRYGGMNSFSRQTEEGNLLALHPTVKPVALIQDAILDVSLRGDIVLDVFGGSGSTLIACERTGRNCRLMELDPRYCDAIVRRWEAYTGDHARHAVTGKTFDEMRRLRARKGGRHG